MTRKPRGPATGPRVTLLGAGQTVDSRALDALRAEKSPKTAPGRQRASEARERVVDAVYAMVLAGMSEKRFQALVVSSLRCRGWTVWTVPNMRQTTAGLPDLLCLHDDIPRVLAWELKAVRTRVTPRQAAVIARLARVPGIDARIVRPADWVELRQWLDDGMPAHQTPAGGI